jgi:hypothetical protein
MMSGKFGERFGEGFSTDGLWCCGDLCNLRRFAKVGSLCFGGVKVILGSSDICLRSAVIMDGVSFIIPSDSPLSCCCNFLPRVTLVEK